MFVGEHVLAERRAERGEALDDFGEPLLGRRVEGGAGAAEAGVIALDDALLLARQIELVGLLHQRVDALEQVRIGIDGVPVPGELRRDLALDLEQGVIGMGAGQKVKHIADPLERAAAAFDRRNGVVEGCRLWIAGNGGDFGCMFGQRPGIGRAELFGADRVERRDAVRCRPLLEERITLGGHITIGRSGGLHGLNLVHQGVIPNAGAAVIYVVWTTLPEGEP